MMVEDPILQKIYNVIPERDQTELLSQHGITSLPKLIEKKSELHQRELKCVCAEVQMMLEAVCCYVESLDSTSSFTWEGFENLCGYNDNSGDPIIDESDNEAMTKKKPTAHDHDPDGLNLTAEERKQMELHVENDPLTMKIRGFSSRGQDFEWEKTNKKATEDTSEKTEVNFNGSVYCVRKCYYHQQSSGQTVIVGIRKFTTNEKKAIVVLVEPFMDTIMGPGLIEEPPIGVTATYEEDQTGVPSFVQVYAEAGSEPIVPLSSLKPCFEPIDIPELVFEPQQVGHPPHNFGYVYEHDGTNLGEEREEIRFLDCFSGAGGFHQGMEQVPGFKGAAAVEYWETACETFKKNHPDTPVFFQKVEDFIEESGPTPADFRKKHGKVPVVLFGSPCQSFSGANRDVDHNSEKDLYRKNLYLKLIDTMKVSDALIGLSENVEGIWRRPNVYFLKKSILDHLRAGYQVRVRLHRSNAFGDPQARPRLLVCVAKKFVEMPNVIETHGPGKHPYRTVGNAFTALENFLEQAKNNPNMPPVPNLEGSSCSRPTDEARILKLDEPAKTLTCAARFWHPIKNRAGTVREAAALQSYPHTYEFLGDLTAQYKQVGNAVPGRMGRALALAIGESLRYVYKEEDEAEEGEQDPVQASEGTPEEEADEKKDDSMEE